jgi:hypothetical protein
MYKYVCIYRSANLKEKDRLWYCSVRDRMMTYKWSYGIVWNISRDSRARNWEWHKKPSEFQDDLTYRHIVWEKSCSYFDGLFSCILEMLRCFPLCTTISKLTKTMTFLIDRYENRIFAEAKISYCSSLAQYLNEKWCSETNLHYSLPLYFCYFIYALSLNIQTLFRNKELLIRIRSCTTLP